MSDPKKDSMETAKDIIKYINTLSTATILFTFTFLKDFIVLENILHISWILIVCWVLHSISVFLGVIALGRAVYVISNGTYDVSDGVFKWSSLLQQILFIAGILFFVGFITASTFV